MRYLSLVFSTNLGAHPLTANGATSMRGLSSELDPLHPDRDWMREGIAHYGEVLWSMVPARAQAQFLTRSRLGAVASPIAHLQRLFGSAWLRLSASKKLALFEECCQRPDRYASVLSFVRGSMSAVSWKMTPSLRRRQMIHDVKSGRYEGLMPILVYDMEGNAVLEEAATSASAIDRTGARTAATAPAPPIAGRAYEQRATTAYAYSSALYSPAAPPPTAASRSPIYASSPPRSAAISSSRRSPAAAAAAPSSDLSVLVYRNVAKMQLATWGSPDWHDPHAQSVGVVPAGMEVRVDWVVKQPTFDFLRLQGGAEAWIPDRNPATGEAWMTLTGSCQSLRMKNVSRAFVAVRAEPHFASQTIVGDYIGPGEIVTVEETSTAPHECLGRMIHIMALVGRPGFIFDRVPDSGKELFRRITTRRSASYGAPIMEPIAYGATPSSTRSSSLQAASKASQYDTFLKGQQRTLGRMVEQAQTLGQSANLADLAAAEIAGAALRAASQSQLQSQLQSQSWRAPPPAAWAREQARAAVQIETAAQQAAAQQAQEMQWRDEDVARYAARWQVDAVLSPLRSSPPRQTVPVAMAPLASVVPDERYRGRALVGQRSTSARAVATQRSAASERKKQKLLAKHQAQFTHRRQRRSAVLVQSTARRRQATARVARLRTVTGSTARSTFTDPLYDVIWSHSARLYVENPYPLATRQAWEEASLAKKTSTIEVTSAEQLAQRAAKEQKRKMRRKENVRLRKEKATQARVEETLRQALEEDEAAAKEQEKDEAATEADIKAAGEEKERRERNKIKRGEDRVARLAKAKYDEEAKREADRERVRLGRAGLKPLIRFEEPNAQLRRRGRRWLCNTSGSCLVVLAEPHPGAEDVGGSRRTIDIGAVVAVEPKSEWIQKLSLVYFKLSDAPGYVLAACGSVNLLTPIDDADVMVRQLNLLSSLREDKAAGERRNATLLHEIEALERSKDVVYVDISKWRTTTELIPRVHPELESEKAKCKILAGSVVEVRHVKEVWHTDALTVTFCELADGRGWLYDRTKNEPNVLLLEELHEP